MAQILIQINGREVNPATSANLLHGMIIKQMEEQMQQKLSRVVCPEHQVAPVVTLDIVGNQQHISVAGCCQQLIDLTTRTLTTLP